jgi:hypothetical protein
MARNDLALVIDQYRIIEAELQNAVGDLSKLLARMCPGVPRIRPKRFDRKSLDLHIRSSEIAFRQVVIAALNSILLR